MKKGTASFIHITSAGFRFRLLSTLLATIILSLFILLTGCSKLPEAQVVASITSGQVPLNVTFTNESTNADQFQWDFGDGSTTTTNDVLDPVTHEYTKAGSHTVTLTAIKEGEPPATGSMTLNITVTPGELDSVELSPSTLVIMVGVSHQFIAEATDVFGNPIPEAQLTWEAGEGVASITDEGLATAGTKTGVYDEAITVTASLNSYSVTKTAGVTVKHGPLDHVMLSPSTVTLKVGESQQFAAEATDVYGNPISEALLTWEIAGGAGSITADGMFTAGTNIGEGVTVTAAFNGNTEQKTASVILKPGPPSRIILSPNTAELYYSQNQQFTVEVFDNYDIPITNAQLSWEVIAGGGTITGNGLYTAGAGTGNTEAVITVLVESEGVSLSATSVLTIREGFKYMTYLGMNIQAPYVTNYPKVRQAIALCVGRDEITALARNMFNNEAEKVLSIVLPAQSKVIISPRLDIDRADELMAEEGYPDGFKIYLYTRAEHADIASMISTHLLDLGIEAELVVRVDRVSLIPSSLDKHYLFITSTSVDFADTSELLGRLLLSDSPDNLSGYNNSTFDEIFNSGAFSEAEDVAFEDNSGPIIPLYWNK